jgi:hypothetical protein
MRWWEEERKRRLKGRANKRIRALKREKPQEGETGNGTGIKKEERT